MHGKPDDDAYERINDSVNASLSDKLTEEERKTAKKRCITMVALICILVASLLVLILILVLKGSSSSNIPKGYNPYSITQEIDGLWYWEALLKKTDNITLPVPANETNPLFENLKMRVSMMNDKTFRLKITPLKDNGNSDDEVTRWEVPEYLLGDVKDNYGMRLTWGDFKSQQKPGGIQLGDPMDSDDVYVSTMDRNFVFTDKFLELGFLVDSRRIFGFGERSRSFQLTPGNYSSWTDGRKNIQDPGELGNNLNGDHPFVLAQLNNGNFIGIFF